MSEEVTQEPEVVPDVPKDDAPAPDDQALGEPGLKALQAERQARREAERLLAEQQAKVAEFEQRDMTEQQKLQQQLDAANQRASMAENDALRLRIAAETGLTPDLFEFLDGVTDEATMRSKAAKLLAAKATAPPPDFGAGARGQEPDESQVLLAQLAEAQRKGDIATSVRLKRALHTLSTTA